MRRFPAFACHRVWSLALRVSERAPRPWSAEGDMVISGRVTNQEDGSGVGGATVTIPELNLSATTDRAGRYS